MELIIKSGNKRLMNVGVNAMQVRAAKSGVGQSIHALLEALPPQAPHDRFTVYCTRQNIGNYTFPYLNLETRVWGLPQQTRSLRLVYEHALLPMELRRRKLDLFHGASNFLPPWKVCPYIVTIYDLSYYVDPQRCPPLRRRYWYTMTSRTVQVADRILTISENSRRDIERFFPEARDRITVIPLAAHPRFRPVAYARAQSKIERPELRLEGRPYVLYVGTLEPGKNVPRIIRAFEQVAPHFPDHLLVLVGDRGWLYDAILQAAQESPVRDRIRLLGHLPDADVVDLYNFCELVLYPSLYEGFGLPPLEAMACGAPVITSNTSSIPEVVGDAALCVDPRNDQELADALRQLLSDDALRKDLRERGRQQASRFSWGETARLTLRAYRETADGE